MGRSKFYPYSLLSAPESTRKTYANLLQWSDLEVNIGIICTCMPSLRLLLVRMLPKIFGGSTTNRSTNYAKNYASNNDRSQFGTRKTGARRLDDEEILRESTENLEMSRRGPPTPTSERDTKMGFKVQQQDV